tara:strand:+ start:114 stop:596 length:483 start_codon:yes stop_codon:yes gene_type:complete
LLSDYPFASKFHFNQIIDNIENPFNKTVTTLPGVLYIYIAIGAAVGAMLRHYLNVLFNPMNKLFSSGILVSNILGACLIGVALAYISDNNNLDDNTKIAITTGFLGSLTTFSAFSAEIFVLLQNSKFILATILVSSHVIGSVLCTALFYYVTSYLLKLSP